MKSAEAPLTVSVTGSGSGSGSATLRRILDSQSVPVVWQPIVDLTAGEVVAFEALARPRDPSGAPVSIEALLSEAARVGVLEQLDRICRHAALTDPAIDDLPASLSWFVNAEPAVLPATLTADVLGSAVRAGRTVVEITERGLHAKPRTLLLGAVHARAAGARVALDDVGPDRRTLALLPVLRPDVVKLDAALLRAPSHPRTRQVVEAVSGYAARSGAAVIAEGIENPADLAVAHRLGATHGQGWHFGIPGRLPATLPSPSAPLRPATLGVPFDDVRATPFQLATQVYPAQRTNRELLVALTRHLEDSVYSHREPLALLATFQRADDMTPAIVKRYRRLAGLYAFIATFGPDLPDPPDLNAAGVMRVDVALADPLITEWTIVVIGPRHAVALAARSAGPDVPGGVDELFDHVVVHDRDTVERIAAVVTARIPH